MKVMTEDNLMKGSEIKDSRFKDFKGFVGAVLVLLMLGIPHIGGLSQELVTTAAVLQKNLALFLIAGYLALFVAVFNLIWGPRAQLPGFIYAVPFFTLSVGLLVWCGYSVAGVTVPDHGIAGALRGVLPAVKASPTSRILWGTLFSGALIGLWSGFASLKEYIVNRCGMSRYGAVMVLIALFSISSEINPHFLQTSNVLGVLRQVSYMGIIALGMTFVIMSGCIDLSVGSLSALLGGIAVEILNKCAMSWGDGWLAILCALFTGVLLGALCGFISGFLITGTRIEPFIATLGAMAIYRSLAVYMADGGEFCSKSALFQKIGMANDPFLAVPYPVWIFLLLTLFCAGLLNWTKFGRHVRAAGSNENVAIYAGVKVGRVRAASYTLTGVMTGIGAFLLAAGLGSVSSANTGAGVEMDAITSVIIGGASMSGGSGAISGTVMGAIILGIVNGMLDTLGASPYLQGAVKGVVVIVAVMVQRKKR